MKKSYIVFIIVLLVLVAVLVFYFFNTGDNTNLSQDYNNPAAQTSPEAPSSTSGSAAHVPTSTNQQSSPQQTPQPQPNNATVSFGGSGFSPNPLTVKSGTTVTFVNNSSVPMWVASNPHPIHNGYPTTGGCIGSTFDACGNIPPGGSWSFKFDIKGSWGYHDHLNPSDKGTIVVQ